MGRARQQLQGVAAASRRVNDAFSGLLGDGRGLGPEQQFERAANEPLTDEDAAALRLLSVWSHDYAPALLDPGDYGDDAFDEGLLAMTEGKPSFLTKAGYDLVDRAIERGLEAHSPAFRLMTAMLFAVDEDSAEQVGEDVAAGLLFWGEDDGVGLTEAGIAV